MVYKEKLHHCLLTPTTSLDRTLSNLFDNSSTKKMLNFIVDSRIGKVYTAYDKVHGAYKTPSIVKLGRDREPTTKEEKL